MDQLREFLEVVRRHGSAKGNLRGLLHVLIGRRITRSDGTVVSGGLTWRDAATQLRLARWDTDDVTDLGVDPNNLPPRDRQRFWYMAIAQAGVDGVEARAAGDKLVVALLRHGYQVGPGPG